MTCMMNDIGSLSASKPLLGKINTKKYKQKTI